MTRRFLITTAEESTWRSDVPVLFLGEWCKLFARRHVWRELDAVVMPYHWDDREQFHRDYRYLQDTYESLLPELATALNAIHGVDQSVRYWRILVGPWVGYFLQILFDRWTMVERAMAAHEISGVRILQTPRELVVPNDMQQFVRLMVDDPWNEAIYGELIRQSSQLPIEDVAEDANRWARTGTNVVAAANPPLYRKMLRRSVDVAVLVSRALVRNTDAFVMSTSLPRGYELAIQARMGQVPTIWRPIPPARVAIRSDLRAWTLSETTDRFAAIARALLPKHLPRVYLEGYAELAPQVRRQSWPSSPRLIFSSTSFSGDDVFKAWAASKMEIGTPLVIGQHGGGYGISREISNEEHEVRIADTYLTWGWDDARYTHLRPTFCAKTVGKATRRRSTGSTALLVTVAYPRQSYKLTSEPLASQWLQYFDDQCAFAAALPDEVRRALLVRLYNEDYGWSQKQRWEERFPDVQIDDSARPIGTMVAESRLFIATYNSTTFLESLSQDVPTIMFWNPARWELRNDAVAYFDRLKAAGILHDTPESAAANVGKIWDDVPAWWNQPTIQEARNLFCARFARSDKAPIATLLSALQPNWVRKG